MVYFKSLIFLALIGLLQACSKPASPNQPQEIKIDQVLKLSSAPSPLDFGILDYKESKIKSVIIENDLSEPSELVLPQITETNTSYFSIVYKNNCDKVLNPGEKCYLKISLKNNSQGGSLQAQLVAGQLIVALTGQGETVSPGVNFRVNNQNSSLLDFGVTSSKSLTRTIYLMNTSKLPTTVAPLSLTNTDFEIVLDVCSNKIIIPNASCKIIVGFNPLNKNDGLYQGVLSSGANSISLSANIEDGVKTNPTYDLVFIEKGLPLSQVNFGSGGSSILTKTIIVKNTGNTSILNPLPSSLSLPYSIIYTSCDDLLAVNKTCAIKILYNPKSVVSGDHSELINIGSSSIEVISSNRPTIISATLSGPVNQYHNGIYYSAQNLGEEIIPQVSAQSNGLTPGILVYKYSLNNNCSDALALGDFQVGLNQSNEIYVKAQDNNSSSDCVLVGTMIHDGISPNISYSLGSDYTIPNPEDSNSKTYSFSYNLNELNEGTTSLSTYNQALCQGTATTVGNFSNLVVPKLGYISVKVQHTDLAGNVNEVCSPSVYLTQPILTAVEFENNPSSFAVGKQLQSKKIVLKDQYDQIYTRTNHSVNIISSGVTTQTVPVTSGQSTVYLTNNAVASKAGSNLFKIGQATNSITLEVVDNTSIFKNQNVTAHRKNCSELYLIDNIQNGDYTVDLDEEGPIAPSTASCHTGNGYAWTTYASFVGNGVHTISASNQVIGTNTDKYLQQTSFDALKASPYAYKADMNGITAFALDSDIPTSGTPCHDLRNNPAPGTYLSPNYYTYGHWETSGCNGVGGDYSGIFWDRVGTTSNTDVDGRASVKIWRVGAITNPLTTVANVVSNNNYLRMFITNKVYQYPKNCADAVSRDSTLLNTGSISVTIDRDGLGFGSAPEVVTCDTNFGGGVEEVVVNTLRSGRYLNAGSDYGAAWGTRQAEAVAFCNDKGIYTPNYAKITGATGSSQVYSFTAIPGSVYAGHVAALPNQVNVICGRN